MFRCIALVLVLSACPAAEGDPCRPVDGECCSNGVLLRCEGDPDSTEHPRLVAHQCVDPSDTHTHFCRCSEPEFAARYTCNPSN